MRLVRRYRLGSKKEAQKGKKNTLWRGIEPRSPALVASRYEIYQEQLTSGNHDH